MIPGRLSAATLACPKCAFVLHPDSAAGGGPVDCPACRSVLHIALFPAFTDPPEQVSTSSGEQALTGESACFFHPEKRADTTCDSCGRFLCTLCDVPFAGRHLCPACLDATKLPELQTTRVDWDKLTAMIGWLPIVLAPVCFPFFFIVLGTGPGAIVLGLWTWRREGSLVHGRRHWLSVLGMAGGLLQIAGVAFIIWGIIYSTKRG
jgi:hypothetical protein